MEELTPIPEECPPAKKMKLEIDSADSTNPPQQSQTDSSKLSKPEVSPGSPELGEQEDETGEMSANTVQHDADNLSTVQKSDKDSLTPPTAEDTTKSPKKKIKKKKKKKLPQVEFLKSEKTSGKRKAANLRKNIKDILKTETLGEETLAAQREEAERRERMNLKLQQQMKMLQQATSSSSLFRGGIEQNGSIHLPENNLDEFLNSLSRNRIESEGLSHHESLPQNPSLLENPSSAVRKPSAAEEEEIVLSSDDDNNTKSTMPSIASTQHRPCSSSIASELKSRLLTSSFSRYPFSSLDTTTPTPLPNRYIRPTLPSKSPSHLAEDNIISISSEDEDEISCDKEVASTLANGHVFNSNGLDRISQKRTIPPSAASAAVATDDNSDDDCVVVSPTPDKDDTEKDERNIDEFNIRDELGRVLINVGHPDEDPDIFLAPQVSRIVKPHQIGGIRFLYDNVVESIQRFNTANGFGCILAHSMGLGKTLQTVAFCDVFLRASGAKSVLIIVPINTIQNWLNEFNMWLPSKAGACVKRNKINSNNNNNKKTINKSSNVPSSSSSSSLNECVSETVSLNLSFDSTLNLFDEPQEEVQIFDDNIKKDNPAINSAMDEDSGEITPRNFQVYVLNETVKTLQTREKIIGEWATKGGVMLIGYEMYRMLALKKLKKSSKKLQSFFNGGEHCIEARSLDNIHACLVDPGPDLVICDEGHRIKNSGASISQALKAIRTRRRVVLTGYPLQNNLMEYWCMVDFCRPNYLGSKVEFSNMFERPISNGQCVDSTPEDRRLMRFRSHVLHSLLEGFVQRRSHAVLHHALPQKQEWVFLLKMAPVQYKLYKEFLQYLSDNLDGQCGANPIKAFAVCCKIWNHADALYNVVKKKQSILDDLDLDEVTGSNGDTKSKATSRGRRKEKELSPQISYFDGSGFNFPKNNFGTCSNSRSTSEALSLDWAKSIFENYEPGILENGVKLEILFDIIKESVAIQDKLLVFSQTLLSLDLIESFLHQKFKWTKNAQYYRLDGSTTGLEREKLINNFNSKPSVFVFLVSTRAGSLGINLTGANRVVVLDASWNPCHDCQAVCRIYRYGQTKPCHIYRFVSDCTLEKRIYDRQINKRGMSDRVVDEMNPNAQFKSKDVSSFLVLKHDHLDKIDLIKCDINPEKYTDPILQKILINHKDKLTQEPFEHESLLIDQKSQRLSATEKRLAHRNYLSEKRTAELQSQAGYTYTSPSYSAYYPRENSSSTSSTSTTSQRSLYAGSSFSGGYKSSHILPEDKFEHHVSALRAKGICVQSIVLKKDSFLADPSGGPDMYLMAGEKIYVLRSEKGTYLRISNGKLIAVRNNPTNTRFPALSVPANQELSKEQLQGLVYSFLKLPGSYNCTDQFIPNFPYNGGGGPPSEQHLPPSASFFSHNRNHIGVTNARSNSGGDVTLWQPQPNLGNATQNPQSPSSPASRSSMGRDFSKPQSLSALLDSNPLVSGSPNLEKLSFLANKFASLTRQTSDSELLLSRRKNLQHAEMLSNSFSQYSNPVQSMPSTPAPSDPDIEVIPLSKSNSRPPSTPSSSHSLHGFPRSRSGFIESDTNSRSSDTTAGPSFYEDFTITVKSPIETRGFNINPIVPPSTDFGEVLIHNDCTNQQDLNTINNFNRNLSQYYSNMSNNNPVNNNGVNRNSNNNINNNLVCSTTSPLINEIFPNHQV